MEQNFEREVLDRLVKIEEKLDGYNNAKVKTYENEKEILRIENDMKDQEKRISSLEESNKWLVRSITGAVITAVVGLVFVLIRMGVGI